MTGQEHPLLATIEKAWGWRGLTAESVLHESEFGDLLIESSTGELWLLKPAELQCDPVETRADASEWLVEQAALAHLARRTLGPLIEAQRYCLKLPTILGGGYDPENMAIMGLHELLASSGDLARQIANVPNGALVTTRIIP